MLELLPRLVKELYQTLWEWLRGLSVGTRIGILAVAIFAVLTITHPESFVFYYNQLLRFSRVALGPDEAPPLSRQARSNLDDLIAGLESELTLALSNRHNADTSATFNVWALSQTAIALGNSLSDREEVEREIVSNTGDGPLWKEFDQSPSCHLAASAWSLIALAKLSAQPPEAELRALLASQHSDGSWPLYLTDEVHLRNGSTYATAMSILALLHWRDHPLPDGDRAVERGFTWLRNANGSSAGRWLDYPGFVEQSDFITLSALVLRIGEEVPDQLTLFDRRARDWLRLLPTPIPLHPYQREVSVHVLDAPDGVELKDTVRHYLLPWILIGATTSYPEASLWERYRTVGALEELSAEAIEIQRRLKVAETPWVAAELLIALKELRGERVLSP